MRHRRAAARLFSTVLAVSVAGCTNTAGLDAGAVADQLSTFAGDLLRQALAALLL